jgi:hypothetical protein
MTIIINILLVIIFLTTAFTVVYSFVFSVGGLFASKKKFKNKEVFKKIAVLMPAYREDAVILTGNSKSCFVSEVSFAQVRCYCYC